MTKNSIVGFSVDNTDAINWLYTKWGAVLNLNDYWALFAHFNADKSIDHTILSLKGSNLVNVIQVKLLQVHFKYSDTAIIWLLSAH